VYVEHHLYCQGADGNLDEKRLLHAARMKAVKEMVRNGAVVSKMAKLHMERLKESAAYLFEAERIALSYYRLQRAHRTGSSI
jgi:hypothetical protein